MEGHRRDGVVVAGESAREQFYDARGYGTPTSDGIELDPVEAAHLLCRGDLEAVDGLGFVSFLATQPADFAARLFVYTDLRSRGFYLSPADRVEEPAGADLVVHPRGTGPWDGEVAYRVSVAGERSMMPVDSLGETVLAVVDEEGEVTYFDTDSPAMVGESTFDLPAIEGIVLPDRVIVSDPPPGLYRRGFYGQPLVGREEVLQLSLVEAAYLASEGSLTVVDGSPEEIGRCGRKAEGERFDRRLATYTALRDRGIVPKTGFKFGADFRTYRGFETVEDLDHSDALVRVLPPGYEFSPRELALDVRLAHGVRKRMVFAQTDGKDAVSWLSVGRLTP